MTERRRAIRQFIADIGWCINAGAYMFGLWLLVMAYARPEFCRELAQDGRQLTMMHGVLWMVFAKLCFASDEPHRKNTGDT